jgi:glucuronoarabinoxylan endo-1,4-beta-xylanase
VAKIDTILKTSVRVNQDRLPLSFKLEQNYPNPFNPATTIAFQVPVASHVTLKIYDLLGKEIATLVDEQKSPGKHQAHFDAAGLSAGVYFYRLRAGEFSQTRKLLLVK